MLRTVDRIVVDLAFQIIKLPLSIVSAICEQPELVFHLTGSVSSDEVHE